MRLAVMQPYFLPYMGYFSLIASVEHFMFFDDVQFQRKSWMSRNRLLNIDSGEAFYIRPDLVKPDYKENLLNVKLEPTEDWKNRLKSQLAGYKRNVEYYSDAKEVLDEVLELSVDHLVDLNIQSTELVARKLNLNTEFSSYSEHEFWFEEKPDASTWGLEVAKSLHATEYVNAPGGESFIGPEGFDKSGIRLGFIQPNLTPKLEIPDFIPGLSILDVIAFYGIAEVSSMVKESTILWKN